MSVEKKTFTGKEVADAIKQACQELGVAQENLDIEVLETGSTGIFGLIRKKAKIGVSLKVERDDEPVQQKVVKSEPVRSKPVKEAEKKERKRQEPPWKKDNDETVEAQEVSDEAVALVKETLIVLLEKMEFPSGVEVTSQGIEIDCQIEGKYEEYLTGQDGKTLDSIQYLLRKMVARKTPERIKLSVDVGDFRQRRKEALKEKAVELAELVKADGKTQVISALNPSERRVVHMMLQDDKEIRSRSVGDGLFKKILIYKPGKGKGDGRKRNNSRGRRGNAPKKNNSAAK